MGLRERIVDLSEVICHVCDKPLGSNRTLCFDAEGDKRISTKGKWRHCDCVRQVEETST